MLLTGVELCWTPLIENCTYSQPHLWCMADCCSGRSSSSWRGTDTEASPPCVSLHTNTRCRMLTRTGWGPARWGTGTAGSGYVWTFSPAWLLLRSHEPGGKRVKPLRPEQEVGSGRPLRQQSPKANQNEDQTSRVPWHKSRRTRMEWLW